MAILKVANVHHDSAGFARMQVATANTIQWYTSNAEGARLDSSGNLIIARTDSTLGNAVKLDVAGAANVSQIYINGTLATAISNSYSDTAAAGANAWSNTVITGANSWTNTVFGYSNTYTRTVGAASNGWSNTIYGSVNTAIGGANSWVNTVFGYTNTSIAGANSWSNIVFGYANNKFLANALVGVANNFAYTGNIYFQTGNVLVGRTAQSDVGSAVKLDVAGAINASAILVNGVTYSGGAKGGGTDDIFYENSKTVTTSYTITTNKNAVTTGPVTINSGVTVTVPSGSRWVVL